jgi:hypothetical protein
MVKIKWKLIYLLDWIADKLDRWAARLQMSMMIELDDHLMPYGSEWN